MVYLLLHIQNKKKKESSLVIRSVDSVLSVDLTRSYRCMWRRCLHQINLERNLFGDCLIHSHHKTISTWCVNTNYRLWWQFFYKWFYLGLIHFTAKVYIRFLPMESNPIKKRLQANGLEFKSSCSGETRNFIKESQVTLVAVHVLIPWYCVCKNLSLMFNV